MGSVTTILLSVIWTTGRPACEVRLKTACPKLPHIRTGEWFHDRLLGGQPVFSRSACTDKQVAWEDACQSSPGTVESRFVANRYGNLCDLDCEAPAEGCHQPSAHRPEDVKAASSHSRGSTSADSWSIPTRMVFHRSRWANRTSLLSQACLMGRGGTYMMAGSNRTEQAEVRLFTCLPMGVASQLRLFDVAGLSGALLWTVPRHLLSPAPAHQRTREPRSLPAGRVRLADVRFRVGPSAQAALSGVAGLLLLGNSVSRRLASALDSTVLVQHRPIWADTKQFSASDPHRQESLLGGGQNFSSGRVAFWWWPDKMCEPPPSQNTLPEYTILRGADCTHQRALEQARLHFRVTGADEERPLVVVLGGHLANIMQCDLDLVDYDSRVPREAAMQAFEHAARVSTQNFIRSWSRSCPKCIFVWKLETSIGTFDRERDGKKFCSCRECTEGYLTERAVRWNTVVADAIRSRNMTSARWFILDTYSATSALGGESCAKKDSAHWLAPARFIMSQQMLTLMTTVAASPLTKAQ